MRDWPAGSSPLTRGKRLSEVTHALARGLIPAHAGKTPRDYRSPSLQPAHPRSRGENTLGGSQFSAITGSSPLTRGKRIYRRPRTRTRRLIPAHAGKTSSRSRARPVSPAHPRSRGENFDNVGKDVPFTGSSPLTRGKPHAGRRFPRLSGLIPAHAGKTKRSTWITTRTRAHPRSRGENGVGTLGRQHGYGSSPLTRGKRHRERTYENK